MPSTIVDSHTFSGTHYEIGVEQGRATRDLLHQGIGMMPGFMERRRAKPGWMPMSLFLSLARRRAGKTLKEDMKRYYPRQMERLEGIAEGAGIDMSWVFLFQALELMVTYAPSTVQVPACTSIGVNPHRTVTHETLVAKNFDYPNEFLPYHLTCLSKPKGGYQTLGCTMVNLPGMLDGMNEHGLTVTMNSAFSTEEPICFAPPSLVLREMLETCKTTEDAVDFILKAKHGGNGIITLADAEGDLRTVEISHNHSATRDPIEGLLINTNHYFTDEMKRYEIPHEAVFNEKAMKHLVGRRVYRSSDERLKRGQYLLEGMRSIDENALVSILRDHGEHNSPSNYTICQHGEYASTLRSCIFYPKRRTIKVLYGNTCQNEFFEFAFS